MRKNEIWVNNFSVHRAGYHLAAPMIAYGIKNAQEILFGKNEPLKLKNYFETFEGPNMTSAPHDKKELRLLIESVIKEILTNPKKLNKIHKETYKLNDKYFAFAKKCQIVNPQELSDKELGKLYLKLIEWQEKAHQHALATTWYVDSDGEDFSKLLIEKTKEFCRFSKKNINFADAFSILTTSPKASLAMKEEIESLRILVEIMKDRETKDIFRKLKNYQAIPADAPEHIKKSIKKHFEKWRWLSFNYMGPAYNIDFFLQILADLVRQKTNAKEELKKKKEWPKKIKKQRTDLFEELKLNKYWQDIYGIAADVVNIKGYRKEVCFHGFYAMDFMLREMAKRLGFSRNQIYLLTFQEIDDIFVKSKKISVNKINQRNGFTIMDQRSGKVRIITGQKAKKYYAKINVEKEKIEKNATELRGTCACSGQAKGKVKIVNAVSDMPKMKKGDVMVAHTTFPNLVPAMKLASAIVTEDGGMTCHAAIVARELGTPCVTGIKTATKVLKDGDQVEINADEGIVKIIKKAK